MPFRLTAPLRLIADVALPPRCPGCSAIVTADHRFCAECWGGLRLLGRPWCAGCCLPFDHDRGAHARCADCLADPPRHAGVRAAVAYGPVARTVALRLKYGGRIAYADTVARAMARLLPSDAELLVPVPLHRWRLWSRGYNQAGLIVDALGRIGGIEVARDGLARIRGSGSMRGVGRTARTGRVRGAFAVPDPARVADKRVALVDDVYASGATTDACTRVLLRAGAARVDILCWARVIDDWLDLP